MTLSIEHRIRRMFLQEKLFLLILLYHLNCPINASLKCRAAVFSRQAVEKFIRPVYNIIKSNESVSLCLPRAEHGIG